MTITQRHDPENKMGLEWKIYDAAHKHDARKLFEVVNGKSAFKLLGKTNTEFQRLFPRFRGVMEHVVDSV